MNRFNEGQMQRRPAGEVTQPTFREFGIRPVFPRLQAVVNQILDIEGTKECRVEVHKSEMQTILTLTPNKEGVATVPGGVHPNSWKLTVAFPMEGGRADGIAFILGDRAVSLKPYRVLPPRDDRPGLRLYGFAKTEGRTMRAYTLQVNKGREVLITEWSISVLNATQAKRVREGTPVRERLPLDDVERTRRSLPELLSLLAENLCFLYDRACGKPMPQKEEAPAPAVTPAEPVIETLPTETTPATEKKSKGGRKTTAKVEKAEA